MPLQDRTQFKGWSDARARTTLRVKPLITKIHAVLWYLSDISLNRIAFLSRVSGQSVLSWSRVFSQAHRVDYRD